MKIKHTLYILLLIFSLIPLYTFGIFMVYENDRTVESIMKENLAAISGSQIMNIKNFCDGRKEAMEMVAQYDIVRDAVEDSLDGKGERAANHEYLENLLIKRKTYNPFIASISIVDKNFHVVASSEPYEKGQRSDLKHADRKYLRGDFFIGDAYERKTSKGTTQMVAAYEGIFQDKKLIGYVIEEIASSHFDEYRSKTNLWKDGTYYILDGSGKIITAGTPEEKRKKPITTKEQRKNYQEAWNAVDHEKNPSGEITYSYNGTEYITYYSNVNDTDWTIQITTNLSSHRATSRAYKGLLILTIISVSLLLIVIHYFLTRRLTRPLESIIGTLDKVQEKQDYSLRIESHTADEVGAMAGEVNRLLSYIEQENIEEKAQQHKLAKLAACDPLTGIKNKKAIEQAILDVIQNAADTQKRITLGFVDIDDFRNFNSKYGHQFGDDVIRFVADTLTDMIPGLVGRYGGDEFLFCYEAMWDREKTEDLAGHLLQKLNKGILNEELDKYIPTPCSIGIVSEEGSSLDYVFMLHKADQAMYHAKNAGKNTFFLAHCEENH